MSISYSSRSTRIRSGAETYPSRTLSLSASTSRQMRCSCSASMPSLSSKAVKKIASVTRQASAVAVSFARCTSACVAGLLRGLILFGIAITVHPRTAVGAKIAFYNRFSPASVVVADIEPAIAKFWFTIIVCAHILTATITLPVAMHHRDNVGDRN